MSAMLKGKLSVETREKVANSYARSVADCRSSDATLEIRL